MNPEELQKNIALFYSRLPPKLQEVFSSMQWLETLKALDLKYGLNDEQKELLGTETTLVLLAIIHPVEYEEILTHELKLPKNSLENILAELNYSILDAIRPQLADAFHANAQSLVKEKSETETTWQQNLDFILSGGNYAALEKKSVSDSDNALRTGMPDSSEKKDDIKLKLVI